jgi:hypothetical protein
VNSRFQHTEVDISQTLSNMYIIEFHEARRELKSLLISQGYILLKLLCYYLFVMLYIENLEIMYFLLEMYNFNVLAIVSSYLQNTLDSLLKHKMSIAQFFRVLKYDQLCT